jgi:hypothetical protein
MKVSDIPINEFIHTNKKHLTCMFPPFIKDDNGILYIDLRGDRYVSIKTVGAAVNVKVALETFLKKPCKVVVDSTYNDHKCNFITKEVTKKDIEKVRQAIKAIEWYWEI